MDRLVFLEHVASTSISVPDLYYASVISTLGVGYLALFVTLRDKSLINKDTEIMLTVFISLVVIPSNLSQAWAVALPLLTQQ